MDLINEITGIVTGPYRIPGLVLIGCVLLLLAVELFIWIRRYGRISRYRNTRPGKEDRPVDGISVVVILTDDFQYLANTVPKIMAQRYDNFELVIIQVSASPEFVDEMKVLEAQYPNLTTASIDPDPRFRISDKMLYNIGIKTARYNNVILTTPDAAPVSSRWLECMAKGFAGGEVVLGYCGLAKEKGLISRVMRCSRLMLSMRYLSSAIKGKPYRGILPNIGFTKDIYLENKGFNHLDMTVGEDDLFIQKIATRENTGIVLNRHATMRQSVWGGLGGWWRRRRIAGITRRYYPGWAQRASSGELVIRFLLILSISACGIVLPPYTAMGAVGVWIIRAFVVRHQTKRVCGRLGENGLANTMLLYDLLEPLIAITVSLSRRIRPAKEAWK